MIIKGKVWNFGDDVNTDEIIAARYLISTNEKELGSKLMEDIHPGFASKISKGDILVAGNNFGCGSSREHAPLAIKGAGFSAVVAQGYARIFYRNAFNMGLPIFEVPDARKLFPEGNMIEIDPDTGRLVNLDTGKCVQTAPIPEFMQELIQAGGLIPYLEANSAGEKT